MDDKQYEAGKNLTSWGCSVSYSKELSDRLVVDGIQSRNPLVLCICKVDSLSGSENRRCEATDIKNEGPHISFSNLKVGLLLFILLEINRIEMTSSR